MNIHDNIDTLKAIRDVVDKTIAAQEQILEEMRDELFPEQKLAIDNVIAGWQYGMASCFNVGQRSGKTRMLLGLLQRLNGKFGSIIVVAEKPEFVRPLIEGNPRVRFISYHKLYDILTSPEISPVDQQLFKDSAIFFEEPFWTTGSVHIVTQMLQFTHRIVTISSEGPHTFELPEDKGYNYFAASWDWNPYMNAEDFYPEFEKDYKCAARDFGLEHSYNMLTQIEIERKFKPKGA